MALLIRICRKSHNSLKPETKKSVASLLMLRYSFSCFSNFVAPTGIEPVFHASLAEAGGFEPPVR